MIESQAMDNQAGINNPAETLVTVSEVGVKYRLLTERDLTLKGRMLNFVSKRKSADMEFWALRNVSCEFRQGEVVGIIGPNGSGKSTLLRVIGRIIEPSEGAVACDRDVRPLLDVSSSLNPNLTGRQNAVLYCALNRIRKEEVEELISQAREFAELGPFFEVPIKTYSSGMLARLSFALATCTKPKVLLVDEVLAVGDEHFQRKSYFRMTKLIEHGSLVIVVSHNLAFVEQTCTRALLITGGRMVMDGRPAEVTGRYRRTVT